MTMFDIEDRQVLDEGARLWWLFLITGTLWFLFSIIVLRFDYTTVASISILFGVVAIAAGVNELFAVGVARRWWKVLHIGLAIIFIVVGIIAFIHPGDTFAALAAVISFFFIFKGIFDIILAIATKGESDVWWLQLVIGIVELLIGFWAAGYYGRSAVLLVAWVGISALLRGITEIILAFKLRSAGRTGRVAVA
jgi:uncharacterized membrane protein HdeD (DUF308 family)